GRLELGQSSSVSRWWLKRGPLAFEQLCEPQRRSILEIGTDCLQTERQAGLVEPRRERSGWLPGQDRPHRINDVQHVRHLLVVDEQRAPCEVSLLMRKRGIERHGSDQHVVILEECAPRG